MINIKYKGKGLFCPKIWEQNTQNKTALLRVSHLNNTSSFTELQRIRQSSIFSVIFKLDMKVIRNSFADLIEKVYFHD